MPGIGGKPPDTRLKRWKRILNLLQKQAGAKAANNAKLTDSLYHTLVKVLSALQ